MEWDRWTELSIKKRLRELSINKKIRYIKLFKETETWPCSGHAQLGQIEQNELLHVCFSKISLHKMV